MAVLQGVAATVAKKKMDRTKLETMRNNQQGPFVPTTWTLTDAGPKVVSEAGTSEIKWEYFRGCRIGTNAMILFQKQPRRNYNILGRSQAGNDDEWNAAIAIVSDKLSHV